MRYIRTEFHTFFTTALQFFPCGILTWFCQWLTEQEMFDNFSFIFFVVFFFSHLCDFVIIEALHLFLESKSSSDQLIMSNLFCSHSLLYFSLFKTPTFHCVGFYHWQNDFYLWFFLVVVTIFLRYFPVFFFSCVQRHFTFPVYVRSSVFPGTCSSI